MDRDDLLRLADMYVTGTVEVDGREIVVRLLGELGVEVGMYDHSAAQRDELEERLDELRHKREESNLVTHRWFRENQEQRERLEALEEIRQRVVDGWAKYRQQYYGPPVYYWFRGNLTHREPMSPEVAALLWPEDTSG